MSRVQRFTFLAIAVLIAVIAVIVLSSSTGDDEEAAATPTPAPTATATAEAGAAGTATPEPTPEPTPKPKPPPPMIEPGKVTDLEFEEGEQIVFRARADEPSEIHIHGYDIEEEIGPDPVRIAFPATITGIFEIEIHGTGEQIAALRVDPK
jgi:hypothetical protein